MQFKWKVQGSLSQENSLWLPCVFWKYLTEKLGNCGLPHAPFDPCLPIGTKLFIAIRFVNDLISWARNENDIFGLAIQLHCEEVDVEQEEDVARFVRVHIKCDPKTRLINMTQNNLIKQLSGTLGLNVETGNGKFTPAEGKPLAKHVHGEPASGNFNHSSVVGTFLYLAGHTCPGITCAVNCATRYTLCP